MTRGRPKLPKEVAVYIWIFIECYTKPVNRNAEPVSLREASKKAAREFGKLCDIHYSPERMRRIHREAKQHLEADKDVLAFALDTLAKAMACRRTMVERGEWGVTDPILPLILHEN